MDDNLKAIRDRINLKKTELGLSYEDLSKRTGLSKSTIQRYVTGDIGNLGLDKLEILAKALNCSPSYLMGWNDNSETNDENEKAKILAREANDLTDVQIDLLNNMIKEFKRQNNKE